ncbi:putative guanine nucleotide-binding protein subunit beta-2-like 1 [Apostichopus japonicus]|uniref:Putative guanine nucleotide-binding protein subunit beta-2-like 1 n=1 Tax=Stichopus japonicus TaxID=307972 RepID=A0A2G8LBR2_STIJA|nr:putative guanine nucleotide-binding protein subunit beta-2-like 1 [Apostichopus japonicus]
MFSSFLHRVIMARRRLEAAIRVGKEIDHQQTTENDLFKGIKTLGMASMEEKMMGVYSLQFSMEGDQLAVGCGNGSIILLNSRTGAVLKNLHQGSMAELPVLSLAYHPSKPSTLLSAGSNGCISLWDLVSSREVDTVIEAHNEINGLDFCLDGGTYATAGKDLNVRLYCAETNKIWDSRTASGVQRSIPGPHICGSGLDIKNGKILTASWVNQDALQLWDLGTGRLETVIPMECDDQTGEYLYCAQFCSYSIAGGSAPTTYKLSILKITSQKSVQALDSTDGGRLFAVGGIGGQNSSSIHSPQLLANDFATFFKDKVDKIRNALDEQLPGNDKATNEINEQPTDLEMFNEFDQISEEDVRKLVKGFASKSCTLDTIPTWLLKHNLDIMLPALTSIINASLSSGIFPNSLGQAIISPILKKPSLDHNALSSYRPVSNIRFVAKLIEKAVPHS